MQELTKETFADFVAQKGKIIVEFKADWCPDCASVKETYEKIAESDKAAFGRVDIDEEKELHDEQGITSIPDFRFFEDDEEVGQFVEPTPEELKKNVQDFLK